MINEIDPHSITVKSIPSSRIAIGQGVAADIGVRVDAASQADRIDLDVLDLALFDLASIGTGIGTDQQSVPGEERCSGVPRRRFHSVEQEMADGTRDAGAGASVAIARRLGVNAIRQ